MYSLSKQTSFYAVAVWETAAGRDSTGEQAVAAITGATASSTNHQIVPTMKDIAHGLTDAEGLRTGRRPRNAISSSIAPFASISSSRNDVSPPAEPVAYLTELHLMAVAAGWPR
jgi:hypothetical protein